MSKPRRTLLTFAIFGLLCLIYVWFFGAATMFALEARYVGWKMPVVKKTPTELPDQSIAQGSARKLAYFGYEFEVPWELDEAKSKQVGQLQLVAFLSGNTLLVSRIAPKEFVNDFLSTGKADSTGVKALYGEDVLKSDYSLKERILGATPDNVGLLTPRKEAVGSAMLVVKTAGWASFSLNVRTAQRRQSLRPRSTELSSPCASQPIKIKCAIQTSAQDSERMRL
ncbi:MAG: hypothetical protein DMG37_01640 [Acidobacteria bacterium]|nr:MAG: hypothetical protein DMG37_01640 [Acidobacteriota bacterium]